MAATAMDVTPRPYTKATAVTASDVTVFSRFTDALYIGGAGNVAVRMKDGNTATFVGMVAGSGINIAVDKVLSTGTTATSILALYL